MKRIRRSYVIIITLLVLTVAFFGASYAFFTSINEQHGKLNIVVGGLTYQLESEDLDKNKITVSAGSSKEITIKLTSLNKVNSKYELYYLLDDNSDVEIGYSANTKDPVLGTIGAYEVKEISIGIKNNSDSDTTIEFSVLGGLIRNELALNVGNSLNQEVSVGSCKYEPGTKFTFDYSGDVEEFVVPCTGIYKLEVYGAQGGTAYSYAGGKGGYSNGEIVLSSNSKLYIAVGGKGVSTTSVSGTTTTAVGGYNGGGTSSTNQPTWQPATYITGSGGGATHIAIGTTNRGELKNYADYQSEVLIVAGGGGGGLYDSGTASYCGSGGTGGGTTGGSGSGSGSYGDGGSQLSAGSGGSFGLGGTYNVSEVSAGGGGGYYGGAYSGNIGGAGGGSGYVGGVTDGTTENGVREGDGYAKITYLGSTMSSADTLSIGQSVTAIDGSKWHVLEASGSDNEYVTLLSDYNLNSDGSYNTTCGVEINGEYECSMMAFDKDSTTIYDVNDTNNIGYFIKNTYNPLVTTTLPGTINITLPTAHQIAIADGKTYNSGNLELTSSWLGKTDYWTTTISTEYVLLVEESYIVDGYTSNNVEAGVRPVITTLKTNLLAQ